MNDNNNNNSSGQRNDADNDFAIIQMKELIENVKNLQTTYQDVFNISDTLQSKDTENKWYIVGAQQQHSPSMEERNHSHRRRLHIIWP